MNKLEEARKNINRIDREIAALFEERMRCVEDVIDYKMENGMKVLDSSREKEVIERNTGLIKNSEYREYYREFIQDMMDISKKYQEKILKDRKQIK